MSAFGNDCHFFYNSTCVKGDSCPFRHCEAARGIDKMCMFWKQNKCTKPNCLFRHADLQPAQRNRAEIPCYWENQPVGCAKANCPFKHFKARPHSSVEVDSPQTQEPEADQLSSSPEQAQMIVHPVVVNMADDSDVEMTSPSKKSPIKLAQKSVSTRSAPVDSFKQSQNEQSGYPPHLTHETDINDQIRDDNSRSKGSDLRRMIASKTVPQKRPVMENMPQRTEEAPQQKRLSAKQRLNMAKIPSGATQERGGVVLSSKAGMDPTANQKNPPRLSVKERLQMGSQKVHSVDTKKKLPVHQRLAIAKETTKKQSDSESDEDDDVEVKSLEQIQREKALRSMGLVELKNGKVVKIAEKENMKQSSDEKASTEEEDDDKDVQSDSEVQEEEEESNKEEEIEEEEIEEEESEEEEEELEDPDVELEEPEIEIYEGPEPVQEVPDTRKAVQKEVDVRNKMTTSRKESLKYKEISFSRSFSVSDSGTLVKKKRRVIIDEEEDNDKTPALKPSLIRRLGKRIEPENNIVIKVGSDKDGINRRTLAEPVGSTNQGTVKVITGIKSRLGYNTNDGTTENQGVKKRLGWRKKAVQAPSGGEEADEVRSSNSSQRKRMLTKRESEGEVESEGTESDGVESIQEIAKRKRTWRKTLKSEDTEKEPEESNTKTKRSLTELADEEKRKRKEDPGAKVQDAITKRWKNFGVWSSRNAENKKPASIRPEIQLDRLGIGIIDIQGGKVVKMGKTENKSQESQGSSKQGDDWVAASRQRLQAAKKEKKERQIYVPPARKRGAEQSISVAASPPKRSNVAGNSDVDDDSGDEEKDEPKVKTFAQIMDAKRQRQKRKLEKEKLAESKLRKKTKALLGHSEDSSGPTEFKNTTSDNNQDNVSASNSPAVAQSGEADDIQKPRKRASKWKRKSKIVPEVISPADEALTSKSTEVSANDKDITLSAKEDSHSGATELYQPKVTVTDARSESSFSNTSKIVPEREITSVKEASDVQDEISNKESTSDSSIPGKRADHSLSDSWLDFDTTDICMDTPVQDDDDLLKEIDELLA